MVTYRCEWCKREKRAGQRWLLAFAAERTTRSERWREIQVLRRWHAVAARHPFAVHFCCAGHLERYVDVLFSLTPQRRPAKRTATPGSRRAVPRKTGGRPVVELEAQLSTGSVRHYEAPLERRQRRTGTNRPPRAPQLHYTEEDVIRAHGIGVALGDEVSLLQHPRQPLRA